MDSVEEIQGIFDRITERFEEPIPIGGRCESNVFYRVDDLSPEDLNSCAEYVANRILNVCSPSYPRLFLKLPGGVTSFAERLCGALRDMVPGGQDIEMEQFVELKLTNGHGPKYRGWESVLVTDVITTARSTLEAHTKVTLQGLNMLCWASLIDRTFGPGPVSVVSAFTGAPVRVVTQLG